MISIILLVNSALFAKRYSGWRNSLTKLCQNETIVGLSFMFHDIIIDIIIDAIIDITHDIIYLHTYLL